MTTTTFHRQHGTRHGKTSTVTLVVASLILTLALGSLLASTAGIRPATSAPSETGSTVDDGSQRSAFLTEINEIPVEPSSVTVKPQLGGSGPAPVFFD